MQDLYSCDLDFFTQGAVARLTLLVDIRLQYLGSKLTEGDEDSSNENQHENLPGSVSRLVLRGRKTGRTKRRTITGHTSSFYTRLTKEWR